MAAPSERAGNPFCAATIVTPHGTNVFLPPREGSACATDPNKKRLPGVRGRKKTVTRLALAEVSLVPARFLDPEQVAAGRTHATLHRSGGARRLSVRRADHAGARDLHQKVGLDEVDISLGEQGTLFLPPSPANGFRTLPHERTLLTVCALRPSEE